MSIHPYLTFDGDAFAAATFYAEALGGSVEALMRFGEMPDTSMVPEGMEQRVAHVRVVGPLGTIMISDGMGEHGGFSGFSVQVGFDTVEEARTVYDRLVEGGTEVMPFASTFWAPGFGVLHDRFGVSWMVNCDKQPD